MTSATHGATETSRPRASGRVSLAREARLRLALVPLGSITLVHQAIRLRDIRLDLAATSVAPLSIWDQQALEVLLCTCPPWVMRRGRAADPHHVLICGGQFLPALRQLLPPDSGIPVMLVDSKFQAPRILQLAAAHAQALAEAASCQSRNSTNRLLTDTAAAGRPVLSAPAIQQETPRARARTTTGAR